MEQEFKVILDYSEFQACQSYRELYVPQETKGAVAQLADC